LLAPANQARINTTISLMKHVDFGAWFAASVAGYTIRWAVQLAWFHRAIRAFWIAVIAASLLPLLNRGERQATTSFHDWPNAAELVTVLRPITADRSGTYLVTNASVVQYYLRKQINWVGWHDTFYLNYTDPRTGGYLDDIPAYRASVRDYFFDVIVLDFGSTPVTDHAIAAVIEKSPGYRLTARIEGVDAAGHYSYFVWRYQPDIK
jgi:hypothetical protein